MEVDTNLGEQILTSPPRSSTTKDKTELDGNKSEQEQYDDTPKKVDTSNTDGDISDDGSEIKLKVEMEDEDDDDDEEEDYNDSDKNTENGTPLGDSGNGKRSRSEADSSDEEEFAGFDESFTDGDGDSQSTFKKMKMSPASTSSGRLSPASILASLPPPPQPRVLAIPPATELLIPPQLLLAKKPVNRPITDPIYRKPFEFGWKRELVLRANPEQSKEKGEVYYLTPSGKRLRTRNEIFQNLPPGNVLSMANFTFTKETFGLGPEFEIIRGAKVSQKAAARRSMAAEVDMASLTTGKRVPKPKAPKGASPPPANRPISFKSTGRPMPGSGAGVVNTPPAKSAGSNKSSKRSEPCSIQCVLAMGIIPQLQCRKCLCLYHHICMGLDYSISSESYVCQTCRPSEDSALKVVAPSQPPSQPY